MAVPMYLSTHFKTLSSPPPGDTWLRAALKQAMRMLLKAQGSCRCKDQAAACVNSVGEHREDDECSKQKGEYGAIIYHLL